MPREEKGQVHTWLIHGPIPRASRRYGSQAGAEGFSLPWEGVPEGRLPAELAREKLHH